MWVEKNILLKAEGVLYAKLIACQKKKGGELVLGRTQKIFDRGKRKKLNTTILYLIILIKVLL